LDATPGLGVSLCYLSVGNIFSCYSLPARYIDQLEVGRLDKGQPGQPGRLVSEYADVVEHLEMFEHVGFFFATSSTVDNLPIGAFPQF
jgi:hypothetical protein